jgi:hypothetical protein
VPDKILNFSMHLNKCFRANALFKLIGYSDKQKVKANIWFDTKSIFKLIYPGSHFYSEKKNTITMTTSKIL